MATPPLVARKNPLPVELASALVARRRSMAARATGRVLDLGDWTDHLDSYRAGAEVDEVLRADDPTQLDDAGPFDTVVSLVRTPLVTDLGDYVDALLARLSADGSIGFLDPVRRPGRDLRGRLRVGGGRRLGGVARVGRLHLDRDLPHELRELGLIVTDVHRFEVPSVPAPFRTFVEAWVRRPLTS